MKFFPTTRCGARLQLKEPQTINNSLPADR